MSAQRCPLVVAIDDDVQWLDRASSDALVFAARRPQGERVAFVLAQRTGSSPALEQALERGAVERVDVAPLSLGATRRLLSSSVRKVLVAVALSDDLRAFQVEAIAGEGALDDAVDAGVVLLDGERVRAAHPPPAAVAKERSRPRDRRELHLELASSAAGHESRALHLALATELPDEELAAAIAAAAAAAVARGAAEQAVVLAGHALRLTPAESAERPERLLALAGCLLATGDDQRMADLLSPQLDSCPGEHHVRARISCWQRVALRRA